MKRLVLTILLAIPVFTLFVAKAGDKPINANELPQAAIEFIKNFSPATVTAAGVDDDFFRPDYKVYLSDGTAIEFRHSGQWEEVKNYKGIPAKVIPAALRTYLDANYKDVAVINMSYDADDLDSYEVKLASRVELKFDRNGNFLGMEHDD